MLYFINEFPNTEQVCWMMPWGEAAGDLFVMLPGKNKHLCHSLWLKGVEGDYVWIYSPRSEENANYESVYYCIVQQGIIHDYEVMLKANNNRMTSNVCVTLINFLWSCSNWSNHLSSHGKGTVFLRWRHMACKGSLKGHAVQTSVVSTRSMFSGWESCAIYRVYITTQLYPGPLHFATTLQKRYL